MSDIHNHGDIKNQINNPQKVVIYGDKEVPSYLTKLPMPSDKIIGRADEIKELRQTLETEQQVVLMNGLGGIGKTSTAMAFVQQYKEEYTHIAWLEHLTDFATDTASNPVLSKNLQVEPSKDSVADTKVILNILSNLKGPSLLVIDNGQQGLQSFKDFLPQAPNWQVLITSREELGFGERIPLDFLKEAAALELFYSHYNGPKDDQEVKHILEAIDYHTLTIELLAKTAEQLEISPIKKLSTLLEERGIQLGKKVDLSTQHSGDQPIEQLFPYLQAIFQLDSSITDSETWLLKQFVGLPPSFIPLDLLKDLLKIDAAEDEEQHDGFILALKSLRKKGWLNYEEEEKAYKMHRVVQEVMEEHLTPSFEDLAILRNSISSLLKIDDAKDNPVHKFQFIPYGERMLELFNGQDHQEIAALKDRLGGVFRHKGQYLRSKNLREQSLHWYLSAGKGYESDVARLQSNLAQGLQDLGDFQGAKEQFQQSLQWYESAGEEHVAILQSNLAIVLKDLGDYQGAKQLLQKAITSDEKNFGQDHPNTAIRYSNLAIVLQDLGDYQGAKQLLQKAITSDEKNFGQDHPNTAIRYSNLALVLKDLGDYQGAKQLLQKALTSDEKNFGQDHPTIGINKWILAEIYKDLEQFQEMIPYFKSAEKIMKSALGEEHPHVKGLIGNFGVAVLKGAAAGDSYCIQLKEEMGLGEE